jgi:hypothetical protein
VIRVLVRKRSGLTRKEIIHASKMPSGGNISTILDELEASDFICVRNVPQIKHALGIAGVRAGRPTDSSNWSSGKTYRHERLPAVTHAARQHMPWRKRKLFGQKPRPLST